MRNAQTDLAEFVPEDWKVAPLRWYLSCKSGESIDSNLVEKKATDQNNIPVIGGNGVMGYSNRSNVNFETISIGRVGALCGNTHYINESVWITDNSLLISHYNRKEINLEFLKFVLEQLNLNQYSTSTAQPLITGETIKKRIIAFPSLNVQVKIVNYIYQKTSEIDVLINKKQNLINLFNQQRQSIITEAVTKGLNPYVKLKDSGVEWIGEIPEHWESSKLKNLFILQRGHDLTHEQFKKGEVPVYASNGIMGYHDTITTKGPNVTIGRSGSVGKINYVEVDFWAHNTCIYVKDSKKGDMKYIYYILKALDMDNLSTQTAVPTLDRKNIQNSMFVFTLDMEEQRSIVIYLDEKLDEIDSTVKLVKMQIEKLKEYRQSLIYEAVTGKIDVRDMELD